MDPRRRPGRCIRYTRVLLDDEGRRRQRGFDGTDQPASDWITEPAVEQGEAPPLPFPPPVRALLEPAPVQEGQ